MTRALGVLAVTMGLAACAGEPPPEADDLGETTQALGPAALAISPTLHDFGGIVVGGSSGANVFTVVNTGSARSSTISVALTGTDVSQFSIVGDNCSGVRLNGGASCTISVSFAPTSTGAKTAALSVSATQGGNAVASLTGTGLAPANLAIAPVSADFGSVTVGGSSAAQSFAVTNTGGATSGVIATAVTGTDAADFVITSNGCSGVALGPSGSCLIEVRFQPSNTGARSAALSASATPGGLVAAALQGVGL